MARDMKLDRGEADPPETLEEAVEVSTPRGAFFDEVLVSDPEDGDASDDVGHRPVRRRRAGRWVVVLVVLAVVLAAGAVGAEYLVQVDSAVRSALPGLSSDARIATKGVVLAQLVGGSLDSLSVDSKSMEIAAKGHGGTTVTLSDVDVDLGGIGLRNPYPADMVVAAGTISWKGHRAGGRVPPQDAGHDPQGSAHGSQCPGARNHPGLDRPARHERRGGDRAVAQG